jgi:hypothetical protein
MSKRARVILICVLVIAAAVAVGFIPRIPQPQAYHNFADQRSFAGINNFLNVISNVVLLLAGLWGFSVTFSRKTREAFSKAFERLPYAVFFLGAALTCFGSAYYHLAPNNWTLVWDRLPITVAFMAIVAAVIAERISATAGLKLLVPLILLGAASVFYWYASEAHGKGDLRFYLSVQAFAVLFILLTLLLFEPKYTRGADFVIAIGLYALAKVFEIYDRAIFNAGHIVSGHTLKHLAVAVSVFCIGRMIQQRRLVPVFRSRLVQAKR